MAEAGQIQISRLLDERGLSAFQIKLIVWSFFIVLIDGYDIAAIAFAAPHLVRAWGVSRGALGPVFSASLVGILFGSALFGWIGDRYGRKVALVGANLLYGVFTLGAAYAANLDQMFWLRLLAGLGIGGVIPNVVSINAESAPRQLRATLAIIAVGCVPIGGAIPGLVAATLVPQHGWQILFLIGGIAPLLIGLAAAFGLPESIKYMALHESHRPQMVKLVAELSPGTTVQPNAPFLIEDEKQLPPNPVYLFRDALALITPLLWLLFALNLMGYFYLLSWTPTLLTAAKLPPATAALSSAALQVGGTVGTLVLLGWINRRQFLAIAILLLVAVPVVGSIGTIGLGASQGALLAASFAAGFCVLGVQSGINVCGALVYPTSLRALGSGWQLGIGRLGSIVGPLVGALFVTLPVDKLYMWSATPFLIGAFICFAVHRLNQARIRERPYLAEGTPAPARSAATR